MNSKPVDGVWFGFFVFNMLFLMASFHYPWAMLFTFESAGGIKDANSDAELNNVRFYKRVVIMDLSVVAISGGGMVYFLYWQYGITDVAFVASIVLTFHCTIIDLLYWGYTWYTISDDAMKDIYHETNKHLVSILRASMDTDPSTMGVFSRLRIRRRDIQVAV